MSELLDERLPRRFWDKVSARGECWEWVASKFHAGYGKFRWNGKATTAHKMAWTALVGPVPAGLELDHLCRNRGCCNPAHLEPVTHRENTLRGETLAALHASRTHCPSGHPYDVDNLRARKTGRDCKTCHRDREYRRRARLREARCG
jgi:hypothetical protein